MNRYFIALLPPDIIISKINSIKQEFVVHYNSARALKSPPHITLRPPFAMPKEKEKIMTASLEEFASKQKTFEIKLNGFGHFRQDVIFINPEKNEKLEALHISFEQWLKEKFQFSELPPYPKFHPHITVAYQDLTKTDFAKAWSVFEKREFYETFTVKSVCLLKHEDNKWRVIREFTFPDKV